jgi:hypothetical protein
MPYDVTIKDTATGEVRVYTYGSAWNPEASELMWSEGNYCCDCNRALFFAEAAGEPKRTDTRCDEERYVILSIQENGVEVYPSEE